MTGTTVTSAANAALGTTVTATATCAAGKLLLGGGARVTTTGTGTAVARATMQASYPSSTTTWTAVGVVSTAALSAGNTMSVRAYALCSL